VGPAVPNGRSLKRIVAASPPLCEADPMSGPSYLIHIGCHKTGTTWLQRHYFTRSGGFAYVRERRLGIEGGIEGKTPARYITSQPLFHFDAAAVRRATDAFFAADRAQGLIPVISHEQLSGHPSSGGVQAKENAWRLATAFPDARIVIIVREQRTMIRACYVQYLRAGGGMTLRDYIAPRTDMIVPHANLHWFRYDGLVNLYRESFTPERVLCLPYELFERDPQAYLERLDRFAGVPGEPRPVAKRVNAGDDAIQYVVWRWINPLVKRTSTNGFSPYAMTFLQRPARLALRGLSRAMPQGWHRRVRRGWERQIEEATTGFYEESNRRLAQAIGIDLGSLGWRV